MLQKLVKYSTFNSYLFKDHYSLCRFVFGQRISERVGSIRSSYRITLRIQTDKPEPGVGYKLSQSSYPSLSQDTV